MSKLSSPVFYGCGVMSELPPGL